MAEEKGKPGPAPAKSGPPHGESFVTILNRGKGIYRTSVGPLEPNKTVSVPKSEAVRLLQYRDLMDASKFVPTKRMEELQAENDRLSKENADLKALLDKETGPEKEKK